MRHEEQKEDGRRREKPEKKKYTEVLGMARKTK
jgi:hypothetical protein